MQRPKASRICRSAPASESPTGCFWPRAPGKAARSFVSQTGTVQPGAQQFVWNGIGNTGQQWPDGSYTLTVTTTDPATGKTTAVPTQVTGVVDSVDLTKNPPLLSIGGQNFTMNQILRVIAPAGKS